MNAKVGRKISFALDKVRQLDPRRSAISIPSKELLLTKSFKHLSCDEIKI